MVNSSRSTYRSEKNHHAVRSRIDRQWNRRDGVVSRPESNHNYSLTKTISTIVYDTLVRAGVTCTSAFVTSPAQPETGPDVAQCSRGVRVVPDISLSQLSSSNAVCIFQSILEISGAQLLQYDFRENTTPLSFQVA